MYKLALNFEDAMAEFDECDELPVPEMVGNIPSEWEEAWWKEKLSLEVHLTIMHRFIMNAE